MEAPLFCVEATSGQTVPAGFCCLHPRILHHLFPSGVLSGGSSCNFCPAEAALFSGDPLRETGSPLGTVFQQKAVLWGVSCSFRLR